MSPVKDLLEGWDRVRKKAEDPEPVPSHGTCTKDTGEECVLHPIDCDNCYWGRFCSQRSFMEPRKEVYKRCKIFRPKKVRLP